MASSHVTTAASTPEGEKGEKVKIEQRWVDEKLGFDTLSVHAGVQPEASTGAILTPIFQSTTFVQPSIESYLSLGFSYSRTSNPTVRALEKRIAALENGYDAVCVSTGMAATVTVMSAFLKSGDHCVITNCSYGGTNRAARVHFAANYGVEFTFVDFKDIKNVEAALKPNTKMIFSESPTNPVLDICDVEAISKMAAEKDLIHVCDSTFATPYIMRPIDLGCHIVIQSTTKFYDGHNVSVGGAVISKTKELHEKVDFMRNVLGNIMAPQVAFHTLQTIKTLPIRIERQSKTALEIAHFLEKHPAVDSVKYPGLDSYPQRELAKKQHLGNIHGGMVCLEVKGGSAAGRELMNYIKKPWSLCENLGATESIITCPSVFTHANMLKEDRLKVGITDGLVRLSIGLEDPKDLIASLKDGLDFLVKKGLA